MRRLLLLALAPTLLGAAKPAPVASDPKQETSHTVVAGETLGGIAQRSEVPRILIIEANGLKEPYLVREGQVLVIPRRRSHTVKAGETGFAIAMDYGVPWSAIAVANGLDPKVLSEIMRRSSGGNWALEKYNPMPGVMETAPASKNYAGGFGTDLMLKDLGLAQENATAVRASTPLGGIARNLYAAHSLAGHGALDFSSVLKLFQKP